ncbi:MAG: sugar-phospahte nucleotidyltransferase [Candidatus Scalindua sp.]
MKMDKVAGSGKDEFYTPLYAVKPITEFIRADSVVWCPFDTEQSYFVKELKRIGHKVVATHKDTGSDFFTTIAECDYIVSNPPYSLKTEILRRLFKMGKPFAMLVGVVGLFESQRRFEMFRDNEFEILYMNRRVSYFQDYDDEKPKLNPPFSSVYVTSKMLPQKMMFTEIDKRAI